MSFWSWTYSCFVMRQKRGLVSIPIRIRDGNQDKRESTIGLYGFIPFLILIYFSDTESVHLESAV